MTTSVERESGAEQLVERESGAERLGAGAPAPSGRVPDFFLVGHHKCGTTAMHEMLRSHPQIFMPELKAPRFLAQDLHPTAQMPPNSAMPKSIEEYLELFAPAQSGQRVGEASESYLTSRVAATEIARLAPEARVVAILREPASFLRSLHLQYVESRVESENDLGRALSLEDARRRGQSIPDQAHWPRVLLYSEHVRYAAQLRRYHAVLPREQVLVLIYDDFRADNAGTMRRVMGFLGVDETAPIALLSANPTVRVRSPRLHGLVQDVAVGRGSLARYAKAPLKALAPRRVRRGALRAARSRVVYAAPRPGDERTMGELRSRYKQEVVELSEYLGRDLVTLWGYDGVD